MGGLGETPPRSAPELKMVRSADAGRSDPPIPGWAGQRAITASDHSIGMVTRPFRFTPRSSPRRSAPAFDATGSSQTPAFGVMGTFINDRGDIVGFFSDGTKVNGFVNFAPASEQDDDQN
jgi:hypothetical protein